MSNSLARIGEVTGVNQYLSRVSSVVGGVSSSLTKIGAGAPDVSTAAAYPIAVGVAGVVYGATKGHAVLGGIAGVSLGRNLPALLNPVERRTALVNMGQTGVALACALAVREKSWGTRAVAFVLGDIAANLAVHYLGLRNQ